MKHSITPSLLFAAAALLSAGQSHAAALRISPIGVDLSAAQRAGTIAIANTDVEPVSLQIRILRWSQKAGADQLDETNDMLVSPPAVTIPAGASYTIRVARPHADPVGVELSYRLLVDELPKPVDPRTTGQGIRMVLRTSMPVFVTNQTAIATLGWSVWEDAAGIHARVVNSGQRHAKIAGLTLHLPDGAAPSFGTGLNGYVLAGSTRQFDLTESTGAKLPRLTPGMAVSLTGRNDALDIAASIAVGTAAP